jgi:hypothetical protein
MVNFIAVITATCLIAVGSLASGRTASRRVARGHQDGVTSRLLAIAKFERRSNGTDRTPPSGSLNREYRRGAQKP